MKFLAGMMSPCYVLDMEEYLKEIHTDILYILNDWKDICRNHKLLDQCDFLNKMHDHILQLDDHSEKLVKHKSIHDLLIHVLHTPGGAPVVVQESLSDCAKAYDASKSSDSIFYQYLKKSLTSSNEKDNFLFNSLSILDEKLLRSS